MSYDSFKKTQTKLPINKLSVSVFGYEICENNKQKYTTFKIQVKLDKQQWTINRRYKEFDRLNAEIKRIYSDIKLQFPGKNFFGDNFSSSFISKRMNGLDEFIKDAIKHPNVINMPALWMFLDIKQNGFESKEENTRKISSESDDDQNEINLGTLNNPVAKPSDFEFLKVIGKGSFGKVYMANHIKENKIYAIKVLDKEAIIKRNEVKHIMAERNVLIRNLEHPFLVGLHYSFQSNDKLYFVLDYVNGGELFYHLSKQRIFPEQRAKFYAAEIAHAIGYMHSKNIIYRDLKPENILIDSQGHIKLTDFGLCKEGIKANATTTTFCGTPEYLAPEILNKYPYTTAVDWWCLGCVLYEMLYGLPPFYSRDTNEMYNNILNKPIRLNPEINVSQAGKNLMIELLRKEPTRRLGASEADFLELQNHPFFYEIVWMDLIEKKIPVPWIPDLESKTDLRHIDPEFTREQVPASLGRSLVSSYRNGPNSAFNGFTYIPDRNLI